ncbi:hypothetical protein [Hydrogenovibrio marinus]|uniref:Uncharacterized protein n=1 Tax=Hydrogenovibrio marinus TaxID=28885 RepID=A0A066ZLE5_HYDMR|nr:hypothetical protein [Hydrogenovibrio marinus]KDN94628.1 hypothetical protein EI16_12045 [Hydrogenovibrio marinus]
MLIEFLKLYLVFTGAWFALVIGYVALQLFKKALIKVFGGVFRYFGEIVAQATFAEMQEQVRNLGVGLLASGLLGSLLGITGATTHFEVKVRIALAIFFVVFGALMILLGMKKK